MQQNKRATKSETPYDAQASENESHVAINSIPDRDDDAIPSTPGPISSANNLESSIKDLPPQGIVSAESANSRLRTNEQATTNSEQQQTRVQFVPVNNYYKNVSDNKDVAKLVSLLLTCINATKKVYILNLILLVENFFLFVFRI